MVAELLRSPEYRGDGVRSFISHSSGATEYTFPNDPSAIEAVSRMSDDLRGDVLANVNWEHILFARKWRGLRKGERRDTADVVQEIVDRYNKALPKGFQLKLLGPHVQVDL
jgi:hypothetical protein